MAGCNVRTRPTRDDPDRAGFDGMATDPVVAPARVPARPIKPDLTLWLLSIAHAVNHAQAVLLPLIYLRIITEYGVNLYDVAYLSTAAAVASGLIQLSY